MTNRNQSNLPMKERICPQRVLKKAIALLDEYAASLPPENKTQIDIIYTQENLEAISNALHHKLEVNYSP